MATIYDKFTAIANSIREKTGKTELLTLDDMAYEISTISGGLELNFNIKRYSSEEELLADTPSENTIGIISDIEITGYQFSATEPENMNEGAVWINTSTSSVVSFDIIDGVTIYPILAKQYVSGTWEDKTVKSWQDGMWVDWWHGMLYEPDNQYEDVTGGWIVVNGSGANATFTPNGINFSVTGSSGRQSTVYTQNRIDLTNYTTLTVIGNFSSVTELMLCITDYNDNSNPKDFIEINMATSAGEITLELDISDVNDSYYIAIVGNKCTGLVTEIHMK